MSDIVEALSTEAGKELVKALCAGLVGLARKIPSLWRRAGARAEDRMTSELERTAAELAPADGEEAARIAARAEITWETRLRDLLSDYPDAQEELTQILAEIRRQNLPAATTVQNVIANGQSSTAQGVIGGNINNFGGGQPQ